MNQAVVKVGDVIVFTTFATNVQIFTCLLLFVTFFRSRLVAGSCRLMRSYERIVPVKKKSYLIKAFTSQQ